MGDLAFGAPFNMLKTQKEHFAMNILHNGISHLSYLTPVPWMARILRSVPGALRGDAKFQKWSMAQVERRRKVSIDFMSPFQFAWQVIKTLPNQQTEIANGVQWLLLRPKLTARTL